MTVVDFAYQLFCKASYAEDAGHIDTAIRVYTQSARMGYSPSQNNLGNLHDSGGLPLEAIHWYVQAVRGGDKMGSWNLAMHFARKRNSRWYGFWLRKAAEMGDEEALSELKKLDADPSYITSLPWPESGS